MNLSIADRWLFVLLCSAALTACGSGDSPEPPPSQPVEQGSNASAEQFASAAAALPAPEPAVAPTSAAGPPAPTGLPRVAFESAAAGHTATSPPPITSSIIWNVVASRLDAPTSLAFTDDGTMFYTERRKGLFVQRAGRAAVAVFTPVDLHSGGMQGVAVDPDFARNRYVYVFVRDMKDGERRSRVVRLALDEGLGGVRDRRDIVVATDPVLSEAARGEAQSGGALRFGPDGYLYVGVGDGRASASPQSPRSLAGKVLRIDRDGGAAPGNGLPAGFDKRVYAYGLREPVALGFHPSTETLLVAQRRGPLPDDIRPVKKGANAGWDPRCVDAANDYCEPAQIADSAGWRAGKAGEDVSGMQRLSDPMWRDWRNGFAVALGRAQRLELVKLDADGRVERATPALQKLGFGFQAVAQGSDGLYVVTKGKAGGEEIWRLLMQ